MPTHQMESADHSQNLSHFQIPVSQKQYMIYFFIIAYLESTQTDLQNYKFSELQGVWFGFYAPPQKKIKKINKNK